MIDTHTDCKSEEGITVGLIDAVITISRIIKLRTIDTPAIDNALIDLSTDEDFNYLINIANGKAKKTAE